MQPITAQKAAAASARLSDLTTDGSCVYWLESRPHLEGRSILVQWSSSAGTQDVSPATLSIRSRVNEYGGKPYLVAEGTAYAVDGETSSLYRWQIADGSATRVEKVADGTSCGFLGDLLWDPLRSRLIAVREMRTGDRPADLTTTLVAIEPDSGRIETLAEGSDFYASPRLDPGGSMLAWISWSHPCMPWDSTSLHLAQLNSQGEIESSRKVAGTTDASSNPESILQPLFTQDGGALLYVSDRSGFWNLYRFDLATGIHTKLAGEVGRDAEFARPPWTLGSSQYCLGQGDLMWAAFCRLGIWSLLLTAPRGRDGRILELPYTSLASSIAPFGSSAVMDAAGPKIAQCIIMVSPDGTARQLSGNSISGEGREGRKTIWQTSGLSSSNSSNASLAPRSVAIPEPFATKGTGPVHGFLYRPNEADRTGQKNTPSPLIVHIHGGPTGCAEPVLQAKFEFFTQRGFAILDLNYHGSSGYGSAFRRSLAGRWGIADVEDAAVSATALVEEGVADPGALFISGGSAGGYTVLCEMAFGSTFTAGTSYYGVADPMMLATDTHKFESHYMDSLIGPLPDAADTYLARSPLHHAREIKRPVLLLQGTDDHVVPPSQSRRLAAALQENQVPHAYIEFPGEGHGFRSSGAIASALMAELTFYEMVMGIPLTDEHALQMSCSSHLKTGDRRT